MPAYVNVLACVFACVDCACVHAYVYTVLACVIVCMHELFYVG